MTLRSIILIILLIASGSSVLAQRNFDRREGPPNKKLRQRIEDLRKVKLLDVLDLKGDQVERFFAVYNDYTDRIEKVRIKIDESSRDLQSAIVADASEAEIKKLTKQVRDHIRDMGSLIDKRFDEVQPILSSSQFAQYVVFESRFRDELQRMILDRVRRMRD
jgi:hypothetical protein